MTTFLSDLRLAVRLLLKSPGFTLVAVATLALGIGANATMFSILDQTLLRDPPYPEPDRIAVLEMTVDRPSEPRREAPWSYAKFMTLREVDRAFESLAAFDTIDTTLTGAGEPERLRAEIATASYFPLLGLKTSHGRLYTEEEDTAPAKTPVVVLSHSLWKRRFGGDPALVGKTITINRRPLTVLGVLAPGVRGLSGEAELWVPVAMAGELIYPEVFEERWMHWLAVVGRLKPGVSPEQAAEAVVAAGRRVAEAHPSPRSDGSAWGAQTVPFRTARQDRALATSVVVLMGAVGFVLLIACASISSLLMARATARRHEMAVRAALGGQRGRLVRQLLTESLVLSVLGGLAGLLLPLWGIEALAWIAPARSASAGLLAGHFLDLGSIHVDARVLLFTFAVSVAVALVFGLLPAVHAARRDLGAAMRQAAASTAGFRGGLTPRNLLVAGQVAVALVLLVGAGLMLRTFSLLAREDVGFDGSNVLTFRLQPPEGEYDGPGTTAFFESLSERLGALPGVAAVSFDRCTPLSSRCPASVVTALEGRPPIADSDMIPIGVHMIGTDYFRTLGIPLLEGRAFGSADRRGAPLAVILNRKAAVQLFPGEPALGKRMAVGIGMFRDDQLGEVVGIVGDVRYGPPSEAVKAEIYVPVLQYGSPTTHVFVKAHTTPLALVPAIRTEIGALNRDLPLFDLKTMQQRSGESLSQARFGALLLGVFAAIAVTLAALGLYGVLAYAVAQRSREIGIRMALGAERKQVLGMVTRHGLAVVGAGLAAGLAGALVLSRAIASLLYGVSPTDPRTFAAVTVLLGVVGLVACYLPARRATRLEPMRVLKSE